MTRLHRTDRQLRPGLEGLDERVMPSAAAVAAHHEAVVEAHQQAVERAHEKALAQREHRLEATQARHAHQLALTAARQQAHAAHFAALRPTAASTPTTSPSTTPTTTPTTSPTTTAATTTSTTPAATTVLTSSTTASSLDSASSSTPAGSSFVPTSSDLTDLKNGPLAKAGQDLASLYLQSTGSSSIASASSRLEVVGSSVGVDLRSSGDPNAFAAQLEALGMQVQNIDATTGTVEGLLPINQILAVAQTSNVVSMSGVYQPILR